MRRTSPWIAPAAVSLSLAILAVVGCTGRTPSGTVIPSSVAETNSGSAIEAKPGEAAAVETKPLADFPDDLAGVLLISGQMLGYTEPCGCTSGQSGGLIRRMTFVDLVKTERKWPLTLIDLGSLINDPGGKHGGIEQTRIKFSTALKALTMLDYSAIALGAEDLKLSIPETFMRFLNDLPDGPKAPKIVSANAIPTVDGFEGRIQPVVRTSLGPLRLGITAVLDPAAFAELKDQSKGDMMEVRVPELVLPTTLADLEKDTDVQILMVQGPLPLAQRLARDFPGFEIVVATSEFADPSDKPETLNEGKTWIVSAGRKGQYMAAIGLPKDPSRDRLYHRIHLNDRYDKYKTRGEPMRRMIDEDFVADLKAADVVGTYPKIAYRDQGSEGATYIGASACRECHPNTFAKWQTTKHAHAYDALHENPKRNREADADCVRCHTTGFEYLGGFTSADSLPDLKGNQCENCHGPGSKHAQSPDDKAILATVARSAEDFRENGRCTQCHDEDNSPHGFDFPTMWSKVMHSGLDSYEDPKVHEGRASQP